MATLSPTTRVTLSGTLVDETGVSVPWNPDPQSATTARGGQIVFTSVAAGATTKLHATGIPAGAISLVLYPVQSGGTANVTVGGGASDAAMPIPPGGWYVWTHTTDGDVYVTNLGTVAVSIGVGVF